MIFVSTDQPKKKNLFSCFAAKHSLLEMRNYMKEGLDGGGGGGGSGIL